MKYTLSKTETKVVEGHILHKIEYSAEFKKHLREEFCVDLRGGWLESE